MTFVPPCRRPENNPEDWFIGRDGKQYSDDELIGVEARARAAGKALEAAPDGLTVTQYLAIANKAIHAAEAEAKRLSLVRRRKARQACHVDCILRLHCLDAGLEVPYGTWGGYFEEERAEIVSLRNEQRNKRGNVPAPE